MGVDILDFLINNEELVSKIVANTIVELVKVIMKKILKKSCDNKKK
ncbi:hypothetical protein [Aquimarina macrocephali]